MAWKNIKMTMSKSVQGIVVLSSLTLQDQWKNNVAWDKFSSVPNVLVFGGKDAADNAKAWGTFLNREFNPNYETTSGHFAGSFAR